MFEETENRILHGTLAYCHMTKTTKSLMKNRYGICGSTIAPASLLDAVNKVGLTAEELLTQYDLSLAGDL